MRGQIGFAGVVVWIVIYVAIGFVACGVPRILTEILLETAAGIPPSAARNSALIVLVLMSFAMLVWGGGSGLAAAWHRNVWLAGVGPVVALIVGGGISHAIIGIFVAGAVRWEDLLGFPICGMIPGVFVVPICISVAAARSEKRGGCCLKCGYSLAGLTGRVCPECGASVGNDSGKTPT